MIIVCNKLLEWVLDNVKQSTKRNQRLFKVSFGYIYSQNWFDLTKLRSRTQCNGHPTSENFDLKCYSNKRLQFSQASKPNKFISGNAVIRFIGDSVGRNCVYISVFSAKTLD